MDDKPHQGEQRSYAVADCVVCGGDGHMEGHGSNRNPHEPPRRCEACNGTGKVLSRREKAK